MDYDDSRATGDWQALRELFTKEAGTKENDQAKESLGTRCEMYTEKTEKRQSSSRRLRL